jgi:hypothetical protein
MHLPAPPALLTFACMYVKPKGASSSRSWATAKKKGERSKPVMVWEGKHRRR